MTDSKEMGLTAQTRNAAIAAASAVEAAGCMLEKSINAGVKLASGAVSSIEDLTTILGDVTASAAVTSTGWRLRVVASEAQSTADHHIKMAGHSPEKAAMLAATQELLKAEMAKDQVAIATAMANVQGAAKALLEAKAKAKASKSAAKAKAKKAKALALAKAAKVAA